MKKPKRMFKAHRKDNDPDIMIAVPSTWKSKPFLLQEPKHTDLAPYGVVMLKTLESGYESGMKQPCLLVIWRGGQYAKEHGLDTSDEPLIFQAIETEEFERITGGQAFPSGETARDALPRYVYAFAGRDTITPNIGLDLSEDGSIMAWKFSRPYRHLLIQNGGLKEQDIQCIERFTGVNRDA